MNKNFLLIAATAFVIIIAVFIFNSNSNNQTVDTPVTSSSTSDESQSTSDGDEAMDDGSEVTQVTVEGSNFEFSKESLEFSPGEKVKLTFNNTGGLHDFVVDEFDVATKRINTGEETTVEFTVPDKPGTYVYYCSVANHRALGMEGMITVK